MGPLMIDVAGLTLTSEDKELLAHPLVGGLILFSRNFHDLEQLAALNQEIRQAAKKDILIAVDHEGGRVQRFRQGFSKIPAMGKLIVAAEHNMPQALDYAFYTGQLMALEVQASNIDISFAPVLDVHGISDVIGDRAFHQKPEQVSQLAQAFMQGMRAVGMKTTAKHFPGHGSVKEDSHVAMPKDLRSWQDILNYDAIPFCKMMQQGLVDAVMPAHIVFPQIDQASVGFSAKWLQDILRKQLAFQGVIFSDDLSMQGAATVGGVIERTEAAQSAGCDMLLVCNDRDAAITAIDKANIKIDKLCQQRLQAMLKTSSISWSDLEKDERWQSAKQVVDAINQKLS